MSLKSLIMPAITAWWLSPQRLAGQRRSAERRRRQRGERHQVHYFHQADDPYSALMVQCLPQLRQRYDIDVVPHLVSPPADDAAPDRDRLIAYSRKDAAWLAQRHGLSFVDRGVQPTPLEVKNNSAQLVHAIASQQFETRSAAMVHALWHPSTSAESTPAWPTAPAAQLQAHLAESNALRQRLGHYNGGMLYHAGEWYWGLDRLHYLEERLHALGAAHPGTTGCLFAPEAAVQWPPATPGTWVDFFFSFRSPYSAIAAQRLFALTQGTNIQVRLRYVLPMVMRGLPVPRSKRMYISQDAAREARRLHVPFGRICDPVGKPTERGLSLMHLAEAQGRGQAYVLSFMQGVWAEGLDAGSDKGLRRITDRAGLTWSDVCAALQQDTWRATAEANRVEMLNLGLWGVPSFKVADTAFWGQDRLEAVARALRENAQP
jgi:2-hydroxychromene-2-carboxylate isomerase